jgi:predicted CXXCH cytochrome family protein
MNSRKLIKTALLGVWAVFLIFWLIIGTKSTVSSYSEPDKPENPSVGEIANQDDYVGSETCKACHEDQFNRFSKTKHAKLSHVKSWKDKVQGCESCHGPGKEHVDGGGDKTKITSFADKSSKQISETCLSCHAGKESHAQFRRGEHWRNNVGCTECHSSHASESTPTQIGSVTYPAMDSDNKPGAGTEKMLKVSEPQLCISCHAATKAQFNQPFHHKVLEGKMKCSDCHNAHGGFEMKQAKLSIGGDQACVKCHTDKQGPFVYEHLPITVEGCATCHNTHGSSNPKMLKRNQVRQLCLECHSAIESNLAPNAPSFHRLNTARTSNCTTCHVKIHGSQNHPAFFR